MDILQRERLLKFGAVPFTTDVIADELGDYSAVLAKIAALVDEGSLVRIKRGLYCLSPKISGHDLDSRVVANALYGPSYVSLQWALRWYGLIPERVFAMTMELKIISNSVGGVASAPRKQEIICCKLKMMK